MFKKKKKKLWCQGCLNSYEKGDKFCGHCGFDLKKKVKKHQDVNGTFVVYIKCIKCKQIVPTSKYCGRCGQRHLPPIPL